jgi:hypothetical protein
VPSSARSLTRAASFEISKPVSGVKRGKNYKKRCRKGFVESLERKPGHALRICSGELASAEARSERREARGERENKMEEDREVWYLVLVFGFPILASPGAIQQGPG